ncbi:MAG: DNA polymerase III subunit chi [Deltaproteobacteria bacterium]|jgi:DNA polymerase-3 subunit chi|nr:DNA polymerase III subunit chi [Deltaproteobacteria bacterium]
MTVIYFVETTTGEQRDFLCRWTERFYSEKKRVRIVVDSMAAAQLIDQLLWTFSQQSFIPHAIFNPGATRPEEPVVITPGQFRTDGFDAVVCDSQADLEFMSLFETAVHFILDDDLERKQQSRVLWQRARDSGLDPIHVPYERKR